MAIEVFANDAYATVSSGGTTAPSAGTSESWTLSSSTLVPVSSAATPPTFCYVCDPAAEAEKIEVANISGTTATVTRGADGTTPVAHVTGFTVRQVMTRATLAGLLQAAGATMTGWLAPAVVTLTDASTVAVDASKGNDFRVQLGGNRTIGAPSNPTDGQRIAIHVQQPASGGPYTPAFASGTGGYAYGSASVPAWSATASQVDLTGWLYRADLQLWLFTGANTGL